MPRKDAAAFLLAALFVSRASLAACPPTTITVDNDIAGSGYSEEHPENFQSHDVEPCKTTYRYLSKYVGDGSSKGKAIWTPKITVGGTYAVKTGYRASVNRTSSADYIAYGDDGKSVHKVVNQQIGTGCTYADVGTVFCKPGGTYRLVLDGNDGQSAAADVTTFELVSCDGPADAGAGPCDGITANPAYELCQSSATTCSGVFNDGKGCVAYCAAAGMICKARYGAGSGCAKEPPPAIPCDATNGHQSDWCDCEAKPAPVDAGMDASPPDAGSDAPVDAPADVALDAPTDGPADASADSPFTPVDAAPQPGTGGGGGGGGGGPNGAGAAGKSGATVSTPDVASAAGPEQGSACGCSVPRACSPTPFAAFALALLAASKRRRRS